MLLSNKPVEDGVFMVKRVKPIDDNVIRESNMIARAQISPVVESVWEERIIAQVASMNKFDDSLFYEQSFMVGQILGWQKISTIKLQKIEKACEQLIQSYFKIKTNKNFALYPIFSLIQYQDGIITAQLNEKLKPHYLELKRVFALRSLPEFRKLSSVYSQQIFRLLNSWANLPVAEIPLEELYHLTNPSPSIREYKNFKARVLHIAHREINEKTSIKYDWEPIKLGKKVIAIRFIFGCGDKK